MRLRTKAFSELLSAFQSLAVGIYLLLEFFEITIGLENSNLIPVFKTLFKKYLYKVNQYLFCNYYWTSRVCSWHFTTLMFLFKKTDHWSSLSKEKIKRCKGGDIYTKSRVFTCCFVKCKHVLCCFVYCYDCMISVCKNVPLLLHLICSNVIQTRTSVIFTESFLQIKFEKNICMYCLWANILMGSIWFGSFLCRFCMLFLSM